ncbi:MAG: hypothetical protein MUP76_04085 [Acidimicrobiia bacterium]|nr:hypothetical protein [Acidimicrobiia bacterium]
MRVLVSILIGFVLGFILFGSGVEWLIDFAAGECRADCAGWREFTVMSTSTAAWVVFARLTHVVWQRIWPQMAPSARQEQIRQLRRGGW